MNTHIPSPEEVIAKGTPCGPPGSGYYSWKRKTLEEWGVPWPPPKGWKSRLREQWLAQSPEGQANARRQKIATLKAEIAERQELLAKLESESPVDKTL